MPAAPDLVPIRITLTPVALPHFANPPLGSAFAAPFAKGGRQTWNGWRGDFSVWTLAEGIIRIGSYFPTAPFFARFCPSPVYLASACRTWRTVKGSSTTFPELGTPSALPLRPDLIKRLRQMFDRQAAHPRESRSFCKLAYFARPDRRADAFASVR